MAKKKRVFEVVLHEDGMSEVHIRALEDEVTYRRFCNALLAAMSKEPELYHFFKDTLDFYEAQKDLLDRIVSQAVKDVKQFNPNVN